MKKLFPYELFLTSIQTNIKKDFANNMSTDIKLCKAQNLKKINQVDLKLLG